MGPPVPASRFSPTLREMAQPRIVSLVPGLTELLFDFGVGGQVVGRTRFCVEPKGEVERVPIAGGTKNPDLGKIAGLQPDFVLANREENRREDVEALIAAGLNVQLTDPTTVGEAEAMIMGLGEMLGCAESAKAIVDDIERALAGPPPAPARPRVFVAIWRKPLMGLGCESYGHDLVERSGAINVLRERPRYPEVTVPEIRALRPDLILLPDEPFRFGERHVPEFEAIAPVRLVDGKLLWWYGARLPGAIGALRSIFADVAEKP